MNKGKRYIMMAAIAVMSVVSAACGMSANDEHEIVMEDGTDDIGEVNVSDGTDDIGEVNVSDGTDDIGEVNVSADQIVGPWHLDSEKNDLPAFQDIFPAYAEFGASMEIKSDGQISWYIGAEGGSGTYTQDGDTLTADIVTDVNQQPVTVIFHLSSEDEIVRLKMDYNGTSVYWVYGDSGEPSAAGR